MNATRLCCATCGRIDTKHVDKPTGNITITCNSYGRNREVTVSSETELRNQGCGNWIDRNATEIKLFT